MRMTVPGRLSFLLALLCALAAAPAVAEEAGSPAAVGPWYAEAAYGRLNPDNFTDIMFQTYRTKLTGDDIVGVGVGREVWEIGAGFSLEVGLLLNHRIAEGGMEIGMPVAVVFDGFPWRDRLPMRLRLAIGPSYATKISAIEKSKDASDEGSHLLNLFNPEIEIGLPDDPSWTAFFRLHHRSGVFKLINGVTGGSTYMMIGVRKRFDLE